VIVARPVRRDAVRAAVCLSVALVGLLAVPFLPDPEAAPTDVAPGFGDAAWWVVLATVTVQAVALAWASSAPARVLVVVAGVPLLAAAAGTGGLAGMTTLAVMVAAYVAVVSRPWAEVRPAVVAAVVLTVVTHTVAGLRDGMFEPLLAVTAAVGQGVFVVGGPALVALLVASRRAVARSREQELAALARERDALVREARAQERTAMARELHDIAAHHLSGIAVMSAAIERQVTTDPAGAQEGVRQVRSQSTAVLRDLRRLVGLLREDDAAELGVEALAGVAELVAHASARGVAVELVTLPAGGGPTLAAGIGPLAQLTAYRLVQESLANASRHAPGAPCVVTLDGRDPAAVVVSVRNDAATTPPELDTSGGFGLVGMRERAALTGAELSYGPEVDGGWDVTLRLPRDPDTELDTTDGGTA